MKIRLAKITDLKRLLYLNNKYTGSDDPNMRKMTVSLGESFFREVVKDKKIIVGEVGEEVAGYVVAIGYKPELYKLANHLYGLRERFVYRKKSIKLFRCCWGAQICVDEPYWGIGLAEKMLAKLFFGLEKYQLAVVGILKANRRSFEFARKFGAELLAENDKYRFLVFDLDFYRDRKKDNGLVGFDYLRGWLERPVGMAAFMQDGRTRVSSLLEKNKYGAGIVKLACEKEMAHFWSNNTITPIAYGGRRHLQMREFWKKARLKLAECEFGGDEFREIVASFVKKALRFELFQKHLLVGYAVSGSHAPLLLRAIYSGDDVGVVLPSEVGSSMEAAFEGRHFAGFNVRGERVANGEQLKGVGRAKVERVVLRRGDGSALSGEELAKDYKRAIMKLVGEGRKMIMVVFAFPSKTGLTDENLIKFAKLLTRRADLVEGLEIPAEVKIRTLADYAQGRVFFSKGFPGVEDKLKWSGLKKAGEVVKEGEYLYQEVTDWFMLTLSKYYSYAPFVGMLHLANGLKKRIESDGLAEGYVKDYLAVGHLPLGMKIGEKDIWKMVSTVDFLLMARVVSNLKEHLEWLSWPLDARGEFLRKLSALMRNRLVKMIKNLEGVVEVRDRSVKETVSTVAFEVVGVDADWLWRMMAKRIEAFDDLSLTAVEQMAMSETFYLGKPVGGEGERQGKILRIGVGMNQVIEMAAGNRNSLLDMIELMFVKMERLIKGVVVGKKVYK